MAKKRTVIITDSDPGFRRASLAFKRGPNFADIGLFPESGFDNILKAVRNEFGDPEANIPSRSFIRATAIENKDKIVLLIKKLKDKVASGQISKFQAFTIIGKSVKVMMFRKMDKGPFIPNAPSTERKKGFNRPLFETSEMSEALDYKVGA